MLKFFSYIIFFLLTSNLAFSGSKTVNSIIKQAIEDKSPRQSSNKTSEQLAKDFLKSVGLNKGDNGDIFIAVGTAYIEHKKFRKGFQLKRRLLVSEALLNAKKDFIELYALTLLTPLSKSAPFERKSTSLSDNITAKVLL